MADSLVLTGKKTVTKHTGTEMTRIDDKRGGNTWQLPRWWVKGGNGTVYVASTLFKVAAGGGTGYLAIASTSESTRVKIVHDGSFGFDFYYMNEVSRGALFDANMNLVEHYVFPKISGGKTMVVTPPDGADRPGNTPEPPSGDKTINTASITGESSPSDADNEDYIASVTGNASPYTYAWTVTGGTIDSGQTAKTVSVVWGSAGAGKVEVTVGSTNADWDGETVDASKDVTIS